MNSLRNTAAFFLGATFAALPLSAQTPTFTNASVHDPSVVKDGSSYYVFGSHMASASTTNLMNWTQITTSPNSPNSLIAGQNPQTEFATALAYAQTTTFWAPDVIKLGDGKYYFYYCACKGDSPLSALGLAKADAITGPYSNVGILLKSAGASPTVSPYNVNTMPNVVDPSVFFDASATPKLWMVYGSFSGGIFILQLDSTVGSPTIGQPLPGQGYGKKLIGGNSSRIEGAYIVYSPETSYYYLFMTFGGLDAPGGYNVRMGRSLSPDGPFLDASGNDLTNVSASISNDAPLAPYGVKLMGNWQFLHDASEPRNVSTGYVSPGGVSVTRDASGKYILVFHTRFVGRGEAHEVRAHQMYLNADGWFVVAPQRYAQETLATTVASQIPGNYKLINHGTDTTATVKTSSVITLAGTGSNGTITGAVTGTWQLTADHHATLVIAGTTYRGVFSRQWDDDNQTWTQTFSALSITGSTTPGVAIWGTKIIPGDATTQTVTAAYGVNFTATGANGTGQWQILPSGGSAWQNLSNDSTYSGVTTTTLTLTNATTALNGAKYRYVTTATGGGTTSVPVTLAVSAAVFSAPTGITIDSSGNLYVSDSTGNTIQKVTSAGSASILAGTSGSLGSTDGTGSAALFRAPSGLALDSTGNVYVADTGNSTIRKITSAGVVTTLAGSSGTSGSTNGTGSAARFSSPADLAANSAGVVFVADTGNHTIRQIDAAGAVTTLAGTAGANGTIDGTGAVARFNAPAGIAVTGTGDLYVADTVNNTLRKTTSAGVVTTLAGTYGITGSTDATGVNALFSGPTGATVDGSGNMYVADTQNSTIRKITPSGAVTTVAGLPGVSGLQDGTGSAAWFNKPRDVTVDSAGNLYVADTGNAAIRKITPSGVVTTLTITASTGGSTGGGGSSGGGSSGGGSTPPASGGGGGGGGGSPSFAYLGALVSLGLLRRAQQAGWFRQPR